MRSVKEMLREIDSEVEEKRQTKKKLELKSDVVDLDTRNSFVARKVTTSAIKCAHRCKYYATCNN